MPAVYTSSTFSTHSEYKRRRVVPAIREDPSLGLIITRYLRGPEDTYSTPALDVADSEFTTAYRTAVRERAHVDGAEMAYEVEYAQIPTSRDEFAGISARFPGLAATTTPGTAKTVYGLWIAADRKSAIFHVVAHGYVVNSVAGYHLVLKVGSNPITLQGHALITAVTVNTFTAELPVPVPAGTDVAFFAGSVRGFDIVFPARAALTETVRARTRHDYFLPGISTNIATAADIVMPPILRIYGSTGAETDTASTTTHPTQAQYEAMIVGRQEFIVSANLQRWRGNIFERAVTWVVAI